jgi:Holliday junction resolvase-like predicted endonuclease
MPDPYGISEGVKAFSSSLDSGREAANKLSKSIEGIQQDAADVAQRQATERRRAAREVEFRKETALLKALNDWNHKKQISDQEAKIKIDFIKKHGAKEWEALLKIKLDIEKMEQQNKDQYQHDMKAVRRVQFYCFAAAAVIAWYLTWGYKI